MHGCRGLSSCCELMVVVGLVVMVSAWSGVEDMLTSASQWSILAAATPSSVLLSYWTFMLRVARTLSSVVRSRAKFSLQRNQPHTTENERFCFSLIFSASRLITKWQRGAMPPVQVNTSVVKSARSTSLIRGPCTQIFCNSAVLNICVGLLFRLLLAKGETTFTSKNACRCLHQNPQQFTSLRALSCLFWTRTLLLPEASALAHCRLPSSRPLACTLQSCRTPRCAG